MADRHVGPHTCGLRGAAAFSDESDGCGCVFFRGGAFKEWRFTHHTVGDLLASAVELANEEEGTIVWFAVRTHPDTFWIFDAFPDEAARDAHANGAIVEALMANQHLLGAAPEILPADVLASKLP